MRESRLNGGAVRRARGAESAESAARAGRLAARGMPRRRVAEIQRARLLAAAVGVFDESGYVDASVERIVTRARVSRRTFYELFENREGCLLALVEDLGVRVQAELAAQAPTGTGWLERVRGGLWTILTLLDQDPALARVCVVQSLRGGAAVQERRERLLRRLAAVLDEGSAQQSRHARCTPLTAEGLAAAALGIVYGRLRRRDRAPLCALQGELMAMIALPYLGSASAARELARPTPTPTPKPLRARAARPSDTRTLERDLAEIPMRLTYRTARVLEAVAREPWISNRAIADAAEIADQGQVSKLLRRLEGLGLLVNRGEGHTKGGPNAWRLTPLGERLAARLEVNTASGEQ
jgi:AcrR family transcriptional regulator/DNA-binding MarR family transcriptional regulator